MNYFAYGSNMSLLRLRERVPGARPIGACMLSEHQLRFHKSGRDGSAKCDAWHTGVEHHVLHGVLFEIDRSGKRVLDQVEGLGFGYEEKRVSLHAADGSRIEAITYYATHIDEKLLPYSWYLQHVLTGALDMGLPPDHVAYIENIPTLLDPDPERHAQQQALYRKP